MCFANPVFLQNHNEKIVGNIALLLRESFVIKRVFHASNQITFIGLMSSKKNIVGD